jgi:hypothetical protein
MKRVNGLTPASVLFLNFEFFRLYREEYPTTTKKCIISNNIVAGRPVARQQVPNTHQRANWEAVFSTRFFATAA